MLFKVMEFIFLNFSLFTCLTAYLIHLKYSPTVCSCTSNANCVHCPANTGTKKEAKTLDVLRCSDESVEEESV